VGGGGGGGGGDAYFFLEGGDVAVSELSSPVRECSELFLHFLLLCFKAHEVQRM
jgi:hypothetical protein